MQIVLDNGDIITPLFALGDLVALRVQADVVGVVVGVTVIMGGSYTYEVSVAGNSVALFEREMVETVEVEAGEGDYHDPE